MRARREPARREIVELKLPDVTDAAVYTIKQFCRAHNISHGKFYDLCRHGLGPRTMKVGTGRMISVEEAARWRAARTRATS